MKKVNIGCGTNKLSGWENYDIELDIRKPLPFNDNSVDFYFAEHVVEHIDYKEVWNFFEEVHRTLKNGGVIRIVVPSIIKQLNSSEKPEFNNYLEFYNKRGWSDKSLKGVSKSILFGHQHRSAWSEDLMVGMLKVIGFDSNVSELYHSKYEELSNLEGHWKVVGKEINDLESICVEAIKK